jgi:hypothetical protein
VLVLKTITSSAVFGFLLLAVFGVTGVWATESPRDLVQAYRIWKLTDALGLSEEQMPLFFSKIRQIDKLEAEFRAKEMEALKEIRHLLDKEEVRDADLQRAFEEYDEIRTRRWEEVSRLRREAAGMLTARQRCQFVSFEERFRANIKEMIGRVRELNRQGRLQEGGQGGPRRPGDPTPGRPDNPGPGGSQPRGSGRGRR